MGKKFSGLRDGVCPRSGCRHDHDGAVPGEELGAFAVEPGVLAQKAWSGHSDLAGADQHDIARRELRALLLEAVLQVLLADA